MSCFDGVCGRAGSSSATDTVRIAALAIQSKDTAERVPLFEAERIFGDAPLSAASYPVYAFRLARCDAGVLKASLAESLAAHPMLAGRLCNRGKQVALTNDGIPFTVCADTAERAPEDFEEAALLRFADFRNPSRVRRGLEPLATVKLTRFVDGSAVLAFCRSHALLDGTSAWAFIADWARAARGEAVKPTDLQDRQAMWDALPSEEEFHELSMELNHGKAFTKTAQGFALGCLLSSPVPAMWDFLFLRGVAFPNRPSLFLTHEEVARIKAAATPARTNRSDGWVSTQEALSAYILLIASRAILPSSSQGRALLILFLDPRKSLGFKETASMGCGWLQVGMQVKDILKKDLAEVAGDIHEAAKVEAAPERLRKKWILGGGLHERGMGMEFHNDLFKLRMKSDITLQLNNQTKREIPDFGAGSGGAAQAALTNAGPTLMLPAEGGIRILFCSSFLGSSTGAKAAKAMAELRAEIPQGDGPMLLGSSTAPEIGTGTEKTFDKQV